jgi:SAM-dependent methyltransferase
MNWEELDWDALDRLRDGFLTGAAAKGPYWTTPSDLASYDMTYAERIGWKWDAVLRELASRQWRPPASARTLIDWGCGSGVAGRRVIEAFGVNHFDSLHLWDHSPLAREFAANRARETFPTLAITVDAQEPAPADLPAYTLVLSHVLNELPPGSLETLLRLVAGAEAVLWVEPGTHAVSRQLIGIRETLTAAFNLIAPCPHQGVCGLLAPGNERHWCHFFAPPPTGVQNDSDWVRFGQRAGIDLRSLPYSYLALEKKTATADDAGAALPGSIPPAGAARILGRAEHFKGFARVLSCEATGVEELELQKRADGDLF